MSDGGPAFPSQEPTEHFHMAETKLNTGMTLRDYFAAKAMAALIARPFNACSTGNTNVKWAEVTSNPMQRLEYLAKDAYHIADAMLAERDRSCPTKS